MRLVFQGLVIGYSWLIRQSNFVIRIFQ